MILPWGKVKPVIPKERYSIITKYVLTLFIYIINIFSSLASDKTPTVYNIVRKLETLYLCNAFYRQMLQSNQIVLACTFCVAIKYNTMYVIHPALCLLLVSIFFYIWDLLKPL